MSIEATTVNGVARIRIARPEKKNAISAAMYDSMAAALRRRTMTPLLARS